MIDCQPWRLMATARSLELGCLFQPVYIRVGVCASVCVYACGWVLASERLKIKAPVHCWSSLLKHYWGDVQLPPHPSLAGANEILTWQEWAKA